MKLKRYNNFLNEDKEIEVDNIPTSGKTTLYRLTSHPVVDLSAPGEFYVSKKSDVNPDLLEDKGDGDLFLITVNCPNNNIDKEKSEMECAKHDCDCIIVVKDDSKCEVVKVEPYKK